MDEAKKRVEEEKEYVDDRLAKLGEFLKSDKIRNMPIKPFTLLLRQEAIMIAYSEVLGERLKIWDEHDIDV